MMGFNNIIGHEEIIGHLKNAIESGKISHSYIFTGEPGWRNLTEHLFMRDRIRQKPFIRSGEHSSIITEARW